MGAQHDDARLVARCAATWRRAKRGAALAARDMSDMRQAHGLGLLTGEAEAWVASGLMDAYNDR